MLPKSIAMAAVCTLLGGCMTVQPPPSQTSDMALEQYLSTMVDRAAKTEDRELAIHIGMLHSRNASIREKACYTLPTTHHAAKATQYLIKIVFEDASESVRMDAAAALFRIGHKDLAEILARASRSATMPRPTDQLEIRTFCAGLLAQLIGDLEPDLHNLLVEGAMKSDVNFQQAFECAIAGLSACSDRKESIPILIAAMKKADRSYNRSKVVDAIKKAAEGSLPDAVARGGVGAIEDWWKKQPEP